MLSLGNLWAEGKTLGCSTSEAVHASCCEGRDVGEFSKRGSHKGWALGSEESEWAPVYGDYIQITFFHSLLPTRK